MGGGGLFLRKMAILCLTMQSNRARDVKARHGRAIGGLRILRVNRVDLAFAKSTNNTIDSSGPLG